MAGKQENLQKQIEELTAAISKLNNHVKGLENAGGVAKSTNALDNKSSYCKEKPARESGYVNWDESHYSIKNMMWVESVVLSRLLNKLASACKLERNDIIEYIFKKYLIVKENTQFPKNWVYVNISDPEIIYKITNEKDTSYYENDQVQLLPLFKNHMHTRHSFEEKYKLKWVDPKEQNSE